MINRVNRSRLMARMRAEHIKASLPADNPVSVQAALYQMKAAQYYAKFKYEFSINQMQEARRSLAVAKIFANKIKNLYNDPKVSNLLAMKA